MANKSIIKACYLGSGEPNVYLLRGFRALESTLLALLLGCLRLESRCGLRLRLQVGLASQPFRLILGWVSGPSEIVVGSHCEGVDLMPS